MAKTNTKSNPITKAIISTLNKRRLDTNLTAEEREKALIQYKMVSSNMRVGIINHSELKKHYSRKWYEADGHGASKVVHLHFNNEHGKHWSFTDIVLKRISENAPDYFGNQGIAEINMHEKLDGTPDYDYICPILKYFTSKSDKVTEMSETMKNNVVIISQKAVYIDDIEECCKKAERLNSKHGYIGTEAKKRQRDIELMARRNNIHDVVGHSGNSGVVFDYSKGCYKAVLIDYGL